MSVNFTFSAWWWLSTVKRLINSSTRWPLSNPQLPLATKTTWQEAYLNKRSEKKNHQTSSKEKIRQMQWWIGWSFSSWLSWHQLPVRFFNISNNDNYLVILIVKIFIAWTSHSQPQKIIHPRVSQKIRECVIIRNLP